jgi:hypothetical protein
MAKMLEDMDLPVVVLSEDMVEAEVQTKAAAQQARDINGPVALVVKKIPLINMLLRKWKQTFLWDVKKRLLQPIHGRRLDHDFDQGRYQISIDGCGRHPDNIFIEQPHTALGLA